MSEIILSDSYQSFEKIKKIDENGIEYWEARELMLILGYTEWRNFEEVLGRAAQAYIKSGQDVDNHFIKFNKKNARKNARTVLEAKREDCS